MGKGIVQSKMKKKKKKSPKRSGKSLINSVINKLPFEAHLPGYQYCGPGTKLKKRLKRNDPGINGLDRACKEHDIAYDQTNDLAKRNIADEILAKKAWERVKSSDATLGERSAALGVAGIMKAKSKVGMGLKKKKKEKKKKVLGGCLKKSRKKKTISAAKVEVKKRSKKPQKSAPRIIPTPKIGGVLPLIPVFAGLSALGALMGGSAGVANAVISSNKAKKDLKELQRHNQTMEAIALGNKKGKGLYLMPHRNGSGLFLRPHKNGSGLFLSPHSKNV